MSPYAGPSDATRYITEHSHFLPLMRRLTGREEHSGKTAPHKKIYVFVDVVATKVTAV